MNSFMRSVSILFSALTLLSAPSFAIASDTEVASVKIGRPGNEDELKDCEEKVKKGQLEKCEPTFEVKKNTDNNGGGQQPSGGGGQEGTPQQQAENPQQQGQQQGDQGSGGGGGNCNDVSERTSANNAELLKNGADQGKGDKPGKGKKAACEQIKGSFDQRARQISQSGTSVGLQTSFSSLEKDYNEYMKNREACLNGQADANNECLEGNSQNTSNASNGVGDVLGQVGQNASDTCGKFSKAMDIAKAGLAAFSAACGTAQGACSSSCSKASSGLKALVQKAQKEMSGGAKCTNPSQEEACKPLLAQYNSAINEGIGAAQQEMESSDAESVAGKQKICDTKYKGNMGNALQGLMGMLAGMMQGNKCEEETNGTAEQKGTLEDKCILPENASLPECICKANPLTVGCGASYAKIEANGSQYSGGLENKVNVDPSRDTASVETPSSGIEHGPMSSDSGAAGAPMGGGSAGIGGGGTGSGAGAGGGEGDGRSGLNANILAGTGGGGGSGGWGAGRGGDSYRNYLPGGAKDPNKALAGQQAWTKEVTGQGGKSNFEKVKDRYFDNKGTLLSH